MFPKTISESPLNEATELTTSSGAEVPKATMVKPITKLEILFFFAKDEAPPTSQFAPKIKLVNPIIIKTNETIISNNLCFLQIHQNAYSKRIHTLFIHVKE